MNSRILVTGASGMTGRRVASRLTEAGRSVRTATRSGGGGDDHVRFDWDDPATHGAALEGTGALYLVCPPTAVDPAPAVLPFLDLAREHGVSRAVMLSAQGITDSNEGMGAVQVRVREVFPEWAVLQPAWFMQNFTEGVFAPGIRASGQVLAPTGTGRVGFIDAEDIAACAVRALVDERAPQRTLELSGPESLSFGDVAELLSKATGTAVRHTDPEPALVKEHLVGQGIPADYADVLLFLYSGIAQGWDDVLHGTVEEVLGRPPASFSDFLERDGALLDAGSGSA
ncbi:NAD(P)H-binding protein [Nocardiopsis alba]|uniref:NAD(P)H-binding protein n=1 Tax=Nocardiopsis alba TaxID=53437 RepID=UPI003648549A